jgi:hypothetical protein
LPSPMTATRLPPSSSPDTCAVNRPHGHRATSRRHGWQQHGGVSNSRRRSDAARHAATTRRRRGDDAAGSSAADGLRGSAQRRRRRWRRRRPAQHIGAHRTAPHRTARRRRREESPHSQWPVRVDRSPHRSLSVAQCGGLHSRLTDRERALPNIAQPRPCAAGAHTHGVLLSTHSPRARPPSRRRSPARSAPTGCPIRRGSAICLPRAPPSVYPGYPVSTPVSTLEQRPLGYPLVPRIRPPCHVPTFGRSVRSVGGAAAAACAHVVKRVFEKTTSTSATVIPASCRPVIAVSTLSTPRASTPWVPREYSSTPGWVPREYSITPAGYPVSTRVPPRYSSFTYRNGVPTTCTRRE